MLEIGKILVALLTEVFRSSATLSDLLVAVLIGTSLIKTAFLLGKSHESLGIEVIRLLAVS